MDYEARSLVPMSTAQLRPNVFAAGSTLPTPPLSSTEPKHPQFTNGRPCYDGPQVNPNQNPHSSRPHPPIAPQQQRSQNVAPTFPPPSVAFNGGQPQVQWPHQNQLPASTQSHPPKGNVPSLNQQQQQQPHQQDTAGMLRHQCATRARELLTSTSPSWDQFLNHLTTTFANELYSLNESCNRDIAKSQAYLEQVAQDQTKQAVKAEKVKLREEITSLVEKYNRLEAENRSKQSKLHQAVLYLHDLSTKYNTLRGENADLKGQLEQLKQELTQIKSGDNVGSPAFGSEVLESTVPPEVIDRIKKVVAEGYESKMVQSSFEAKKYKKKCAELEKQLVAAMKLQLPNVDRSSSCPSKLASDDTPCFLPNVDPGQTTPMPLEGTLLSPTLSGEPSSIKVKKEELMGSTVWSNLPRLKEIIDLTMDDENDAVTPPPVPNEKETTDAPMSNLNDPSPSLLQPSSSSGSSPSLPAPSPPPPPPQSTQDPFVTPFRTSLSLNVSSGSHSRPQVDESLTAGESLHRAKRQRTIPPEHPTLSPITILSDKPNNQILTSHDKTLTVGGRDSNSLIPAPDRSNQDSNEGAAIVKQELVGELSIMPQKTMSIKHYKLAYAEEKHRMICRMCLRRKVQVDAKASVASFSMHAPMKDLSGHLQQQHPQGYSSLLNMSDTDIAVMNKTLAAPQGGK